MTKYSSKENEILFYIWFHFDQVFLHFRFFEIKRIGIFKFGNVISLAKCYNF